MQAKTIAISIALKHGRRVVGGQLSGFAFVDAGFLSGRITGHKLTGPEKVLLTAMTFTGCPIAARTSDPSLNPWLVTGGSYRGVRSIHGRGFDAQSTITATGGESGIRMTLEVELSGTLPSLASIPRPFQEAIWECSPGRLSGAFTVEFMDRAGALVSAKATTDYALPTEKVGFRPVWRNILILNERATGALSQTEQIDLFGSEEEATGDLVSKQLAMGAIQPGRRPS